VARPGRSVAVMSVALFVAGWAVVAAGGLPTEMQRILEGRVTWWHSKVLGLASSFLELLCGFGLLRAVLMMFGFGRLSMGKAALMGALGLFLLVEGLLRLAISPHLEGVALPSLPVVLVARVVGTFRGTA
jgi:hypothetical protein